MTGRGNAGVEGDEGHSGQLEAGLTNSWEVEFKHSSDDEELAEWRRNIRSK
jgi:hypothetical protein